MIRLICRKVQYIKPRASIGTLRHCNSFTTSSHKHITELNSNTDPQSLTLSYLQRSCGFSLELAISASKKLHFDTTHKPDSVLKLLRSHGLTQTHIKNLITKRPTLLLADLDNILKPNMVLLESLGFTGTTLAKLLYKNPRILEADTNTTVEFFRTNGFSENQIKYVAMKRPTLFLHSPGKNLKPKLEFFKSLGLSELEIARILSAEPYILQRSLDKQIIPCIQCLKRLLVTDENVRKAIVAGCPILECNVEKVLEPNISMLVNHGVPDSLILKLILIQPRSLVISIDRLNEIIVKVKQLGFAPTNLLFVLAIRSMAVMSKALWEKKLEAFMSFGLRREDIYSAFKLQPMCMIVSEKKIRKLMGFFADKLNMKPLTISKNPNLLLLSLEKRILPRCSVLQLLMSKELIKRNLSLIHVLKMTEKTFVEKIVTKYQHIIPEIFDAHQGKIEFQGFPFALKM